jgi:hypothetical protein
MIKHLRGVQKTYILLETGISPYFILMYKVWVIKRGFKTPDLGPSQTASEITANSLLFSPTKKNS